MINYIIKKLKGVKTYKELKIESYLLIQSIQKINNTAVQNLFNSEESYNDFCEYFNSILIKVSEANNKQEQIASLKKELISILNIRIHNQILTSSDISEENKIIIAKELFKVNDEFTYEEAHHYSMHLYSILTVSLLILTSILKKIYPEKNDWMFICRMGSQQFYNSLLQAICSRAKGETNIFEQMLEVIIVTKEDTENKIIEGYIWEMTDDEKQEVNSFSFLIS